MHTEKVCNTGIAFGVELPESFLWISILICLTAIFLSIGWFVMQSRIWNALGLILMAFGGILNAIERFLYGCVTDTFLITPLFPLFNSADILIMIGAFVFLKSFFTNTNR